jgi:hypothetical protein
VTNAHEDAARARKVVQLLGVIPAGRTQGENDVLALFLESLSHHQRAVYELLADLKHPASDTTWGLVIAAVRARHVPGDGGAIDRHRDLRRPDFGPAVARQHRVHPDLPPERAPNGCVPCAALQDALDAAFDAGVTATIRAVGL